MWTKIVHPNQLKIHEDVRILDIDEEIARMAKLADALASGASDRKVLGVQVPLRAQDGEIGRPAYRQAGALASGASDRKVLGVQLPLRAQKGLEHGALSLPFNIKSS